MNEAQRLAVTHGEGPLLVLAGPGSGKTFTVTNRILYLLDMGISPEEILVITFTKEAAEAMQRRFRELSGSNAPVSFGTFHSVFYHILLEAEKPRRPRLFAIAERKKILLRVLEGLMERRKEHQTEKNLQSAENFYAPENAEDILQLLAAVSLYKNTGDFCRARREAPSVFREYFEEIAGSFAREMQLAGGIDFDDMLFLCKKHLETDGEFRARWQKRFRHILIDEFQDSNPVQYEVLRLLASAPYNLFAVGDDDQSIYGFRGAEPAVMRRYQEDFSAERILLNVNYRCKKEIVQASLSVIGENKTRFVKQLYAVEKEGETREGEMPLRLTGFPDKESENAWLLRELKSRSASYAKDGLSCAVLFRTNSAMQRTAAALHGAGIPFAMREETRSIYETFPAKDITAYLLLAEGEWKREYLLRILNKPSRYISREAVGEGRSLSEMQEYYRRCGETEIGRCRCQDAVKALELLEKQMRTYGKMSPGLAVSYILKAVGYEEYLRRVSGGNTEKLRGWLELAEWLKRDAGRFGSAREWKRAQTAYTEAMPKKRRLEEKTQEAIRLMTVHGAKGLEFDRVILPDCNERVYPLGELQEQETVEEERRIFYVAMTRAKRSLEMLYLSGDSASSGLPSRFLNPLFTDQAYSSSSSTSSSNSQPSRYSSKASATFSYSESSSI